MGTSFDEIWSRFSEAREEARAQLKSVSGIEMSAEERLLENKREQVIQAIDRIVNEVREAADRLSMSYVLVSRIGDKYELIPHQPPLLTTMNQGHIQRLPMPLPTLLRVVDELKTCLRDGLMDEKLRLPPMRLIVEQALKVGLANWEKTHGNRENKPGLSISPGSMSSAPPKRPSWRTLGKITRVPPSQAQSSR
jgi:hypothetical protein